MIWSNIVIESSAGTDPLTSHGHRKSDAQRISDLIEGYQAKRVDGRTRSYPCDSALSS